MSEGKGPQSEVRSSVGDGSQAVFNGVDGLVNKHLSKLEILSFPVTLCPLPYFPILGSCVDHLSTLSPHLLCYMCLPSFFITL